MRIDQIKTFTDGLDGWLTEKEGRLLFELARRCAGRGVIVEIGSWKGKSTIWLGSGAKAGTGARVFAIDPHTGSSEHQKALGPVWTFDAFVQNLKTAGVDDIVEPVIKTSKEAAQVFDHPIELIFIDGGHEYESVKSDYELWFPKVIDGGIMAFHDTTNFNGPKKLVDQEIFTSRHFRNVRFVHSITFAQKVGKNTLSDRLKNRYTLLLKTTYQSPIKLWIPEAIRNFGKKLTRLGQ